MVTVANPIYDSVFKYLMEDERIARTILSATSDAKVRQLRNVEEEFFMAIENRDTAIMMRDQRIKEQDNQIAEQSNQIAEQHKALINVAKVLKQSGNSIEEIVSITGLSVEEIKEL